MLVTQSSNVHLIQVNTMEDAYEITLFNKTSEVKVLANKDNLLELKKEIEQVLENNQ